MVYKSPGLLCSINLPRQTKTSHFLCYYFFAKNHEPKLSTIILLHFCTQKAACYQKKKKNTLTCNYISILPWKFYMFLINSLFSTITISSFNPYLYNSTQTHLSEHIFMFHFSLKLTYCETTHHFSLHLKVLSMLVAMCPCLEFSRSRIPPLIEDLLLNLHSGFYFLKKFFSSSV